ncbi:MAG: nucleoside-triphosphatase [Bacteroidales bacterium]
MNNKHEISEKWIKASIIGTMWAASEIVLGSFFHNLKIPFSSNILTGIGIIILISSAYKWKDKGMFWRAGTICALMKTMSPSAVIFGPMIAIFSQAALLELSVRVFRINIVGFIVGAMLAMTWNLFQKIVNFIIFYGFNIVQVYADLLKYAQKQLGLQFDIVWLPILFLLLVYCLLGLLSALAGIRIGRKLLVQPAEKINVKYNNFSIKTSDFAESFQYSVLWLIVNLLLIVTALLLLNFAEWYIWSSAIAIIVFAWILRYKRALRQLSKPRFWIYFVIITLLTAFVFNKMQSQSLINGLIIGIQMNFRAIVIVLGFSVLGTELYNPRIRNFFLKTWFRQLPMALELSFESLPLMIANIPEFKTILKNPVSVIYQFISQIEYRLDEVKKSLNKKIFIISGAVAQGKTSRLRNLVSLLKSENIAVGGILSPRVMENEITTGYDVEDISTGKREAFLRINDENNGQKIGKYNILPSGLQAGKHILAGLLDADNKIIIIDEVGKLELEEGGWAPKLNELVLTSKSTLILSVRNKFVEQVKTKWGLENAVVLNVDDFEIPAFVKNLLLS